MRCRKAGDARAGRPNGNEEQVVHHGQVLGSVGVSRRLLVAVWLSRNRLGVHAQEFGVVASRLRPQKQRFLARLFDDDSVGELLVDQSLDVGDVHVLLPKVENQCRIYYNTKFCILSNLLDYR
jgi:hypothetical protein